MKKTIAMLLVLVMVCSLFASCGAEPEAPAEQVEKFKIGFAYLPDSDALSAEFHRALDYAAESFGCEMVYYDLTAYDIEAIQAAFENLVQQGCDGLIDCVGMSASTAEQMLEKGIYLSMPGGYSEEMYNVCNGSEYFAGFGMVTSEGASLNYELGYSVMKAFAEKGLKNVAYMGSPPGWEAGDELVRGYEEGIRDFGLNLVTSYLGYDTATGAADIIASYGAELDAIASNGQNDPLVAAVVNSGYDIKIGLSGSCTDQAALMESGVVVVAGTGNFTSVSMAFVQLYNAMSGGDVLFADTHMYDLPPYLLLTSATELEAYEKCCQGDIPGYSADELKRLTSTFNPDATVEEKEALYKEYCTSEYFNIKKIAERQGVAID